ncbi:RagB/SusD family nutrient uptake outer membrane protein [Prevotella sp. 10(H)]|uniref:RagB/SusD family nutrient uptake outer membrane protein n=1 Tax=Prevotella sp. 10(H) TaxID=1158294 RepID=UPI0004A7732B|nr:RagB/SusD family nutrient uptake outer membrane protein [Prevotella sp. 10(H)]
MKIKHIILSLLLTFSFSSCSDFLSVDHYFEDLQTEDRIFKSRDYTEQWLANAYKHLLLYNLEIGHQEYTITNCGDDIYYTEGGNCRSMKAGTYQPGWYFSDWTQSFQGIRQASILLQKVDINEDYTPEELADVKAQARFVRGYYYWLLLRKYGPVPILPDEGLDYDAEYDKLSLPRNTYDECADYIAKEMELAAKDLPYKRDIRSASRPTRGAALATRAKALLYAASPLANGNTEMADFTDHTGKQLISQTYDESKWARAAAAAYDVINLKSDGAPVYRLYTATKRATGSVAYPATIIPPHHPKHSDKDFPAGWANIDPFESYRSLFNGDLYVVENPELIFSRGENQTYYEYGIVSLTRHQMPQGLGGFNCHGITGKQCDAYSMNDGTPFDTKNSMKGFVTADEETKGIYPPLKEGVWKEYANREPRFYASVAYNGAVWPGASARQTDYLNKRAWYYRGELEGRDSGERWLPTGIGMMKFVNPKDNELGGGRIYPKVDLAIRYADILLMYAEALNELTSTYQIPSWDGTETYPISRNTPDISSALSQVRIRAGVPDFTADIYADYNKLQKAIKRERQIELMGENQRFFDVRRWKDAPVEESQIMYGCNTLMTTENAEKFYDRVEIPQFPTTFTRKMYFWPVSFTELQRNKNLTQIPGWQTYD